MFADSDLQIELSELTKAANRANVSFYTIDPRGLVAGPDINEDVPMNEWSQYVSKTRASLQVLAELTGGIAVVNENNFEDALQRIDAETSDYYVLGYYSSNPDPTVRTRRIAVNVNREDVTIRHRRALLATLARGAAVRSHRETLVLGRVGPRSVCRTRATASSR